MWSIRRALGIVLLAQGMHQSATTDWAANLNQRLAEHAAGRPKFWIPASGGSFFSSPA